MTKIELQLGLLHRTTELRAVTCTSEIPAQGGHLGLVRFQLTPGCPGEESGFG